MFSVQFYMRWHLKENHHLTIFFFKQGHLTIFVEAVSNILNNHYYQGENDEPLSTTVCHSVNTNNLRRFMHIFIFQIGET